MASELARNLRSAISCSAHYKGECARLYPSDVGRLHDASSLDDVLHQIADSIDADAEAEKTRIEVVGMYAQTALANRVRLLTVLLTVVTVLVLLATVLVPLLKSDIIVYRPNPGQSVNVDATP